MSTLQNYNNSSNNLDRLTRELEKMNSKTTFEKKEPDPRYWRAQTDSAGNGYAVIRFLEAPVQDGPDALPWVRKYNHGFYNPSHPKGRKSPWYIELSRTTLGKEKDPVADFNSKLWNTNNKVHQKFVSDHTKRKTNFTSGIKVIKDEKNPQNEGKVFLFEYGKKIFEKIAESMKPPFPDLPKVDPFSFTHGANFVLRIRKNSDGYADYTLSQFETPSPIGDDAEITRIRNCQHSLAELISPDKFKSYDELKERLDFVLGYDTAKWEDPYVSPGVRTVSKATSTIEEVPVDDGDDELQKRFGKFMED